MIKAEQAPLGERVARDSAAAAVGALAGALVSKMTKAPMSPALLGAGSLAGVAIAEAASAAQQDAGRACKNVPQSKMPPGHQSQANYPRYVETIQKHWAAVTTVQAAPSSKSRLQSAVVDPDDWRGGDHPLDLLDIQRLPDNQKGWLFALVSHGLACMDAYERDLYACNQFSWNFRPWQANYSTDFAPMAWEKWHKRRVSTYRMEAPPPTADVGPVELMGAGGGYPFIQWINFINERNVGKRIAALAQSYNPSLEILQQDGWDNYGFRSNYSMVPWDNWKGVVPNVPSWWYQLKFTKAGYYESLRRYYKTGAWLVWAAEMYRLHALKRAPTRQGGQILTRDSFVNGDAPDWWKMHCRAWGVGCSNKARIMGSSFLGPMSSWRGYPRQVGSDRLDTKAPPQGANLATMVRAAQNGKYAPVIPHGWGGSIEDMLHLVALHTWPPGALPTGTELADQTKGAPRHVADWPIDKTGNLSPGLYLPTGFYDYQEAMQQARLRQADGPSLGERIALGVLAAAFEIVVTVASEGTASVPAGFAIGALTQVIRLAERYMFEASSTGRNPTIRLSDITTLAIKIVANTDIASTAVSKALEGTTGRTLRDLKGAFLGTLARMHGMEQQLEKAAIVAGEQLYRTVKVAAKDQINWPYAPALFDNLRAQLGTDAKSVRLQKALDSFEA